MHQYGGTNDPSRDLFSNEQTVEAIRLTDFLEWAAFEEQSQTGNIAYPLSLPPIQRGFVWKPRQIADLWDSLLRGMPIGSLMLQRHEGGDFSRGISHAANEEGVQRSRAGYHLLDGQQRTLAMLLGWPEGSKDPERRLWVDLGEDGKNGARFMLRVSSRSQPFGFQRGTHEKLSRGDRRKAYEHHCDKYPKDLDKQFHELDLDVTRPWKAGTEKELFFVQLRDVWNVVRNESADKWEEIVATTLVGCELDEAAMGRLQELCKALQMLKKAWIALVYVPTLHKPMDNELDDPAHDPLTMLFERISTGGTRLSPEDLLFSIIKQAYPESHNFVHQIHADIGTLLTAPDYVMTALRLACAIDSETQHADNANPSAREFHRYLKDGKLLGDAQQPGPLRRMIMLTNESSSNPLVLAFKSLKDLLRYKSEPVHGTRDIGIPLAMFPYLNRPLVQVLLFWLVRPFFHGSPDPKLLEASRDDLVRFVLFWVLCNHRAKDAYDASEAAFEILRTHPISQPFPGRELYKRITEGGKGHDPSFVQIVHPEALNVLDLTPDPRLRSMEMRFQNIMGEWNNGLRDLFSDFWWRKDLLLWLERDYVERKFCKYGFLAGRDERTEDSVPYDFDHLVPQAHWSDLRSARLDERTVGKEVKVAFENRWIRNSLGNAIGNYRVVDSSENRSRGDKPLEEVLTIEDWKQNFAFEPSGEQLHWWLRASPTAPEAERCIWGEERIKAFQAAIEHRTVGLYKQYFGEAGFHAWCDGDLK